MKKIALITASILALGAASIAADRDGLSTVREEVSLGSATLAVSPAANPTGSDTAETGMIEREVRLVRSVALVRSCDDAYWPYYPADCLTAPEPAGR